MPSPSSKYAPYYSGHQGTFETFLQEYESLADRCMLSGPQRVGTIVCYMAPSVREVLKSVNRFCSHDWSDYRQFLVDIFGTPRHLVARQELLNFVQDSSRKRMFCEDDVLQYYRQFSSFAAPIAHTRHLSEMQRDAAFWCGFHPTDRSMLQPALLTKYPYKAHDDPFPFDDVLSCARAAFAYHDPFLSWPQEEPFKHQSVKREQSVSKHVPPVTFGFRVLKRNDTLNDETMGDPSELPTSSPDPQPPSDFPSSFSTSAFQPQTEPTLVHSEPEAEDQPELEPATNLSTPPSSLPHPTPSSVSYSLATSGTDDDPELTFLPSASSVPSVELECPSSPMQRTTEDHLKPEPVRTPSIVLISHSLPSTLSLDSLNAGNAEPPENRVPLPSMFSVPSASSDLSPASLSPSLVLDDLKLESTPAPIVTVLLSSPERPPLSSSNIVPQLPPPLKYTPSVPVSPHHSSTILTPLSLLRLSPNGLITPPSPSPLEVTMFGPISPPLEVPPDELISSYSPPSLPPQRPPGLTPIALQVSTPLESSLPATSTQPVRHMSIPADSLSTPLQIAPSRLPSLLLSGPAPVNFVFPLSIPAISVSDLVKTLSSQTHEFSSKDEDLAGSRSDAAKPRNAFAYQFRREQYTLHPPCFVFDPGGLASALDLTHEYAFERSPRPPSASITESSITAPSHVCQAQRRNSVVVSRSTLTPSVNDDITSTPPPLPSSPRPYDPIPAPFTSIDYAPPHSFEPSNSPLTDVPSSCSSSCPTSCPPSFLLVEESVFRHAPYLDPRLLHHVDLFRYHHHSSLSLLTDIPSLCPPSFPLVDESPFRHAPYLDPRLLHFNRSRPLAHSHHFLFLFLTSLLSFVTPSLTTLAFRLLSSPSSLSVQPSSTHTARADDRQRKSKPRGSTHDTPVPTLIHADIRTIFTAKTLEEAARRSLTGDGQDFDPPGGVRILRALGPKSHVFGTFGLGPASRGSPTISVSRSHGVVLRYRSPSIAFPLLSIRYTHTHTLSLSLLPFVTFPIPSRHRQ
ncbi:hypothetical protein EDB85DRAFT_2221248 [Lactarius pseudohatsudake]|nr:hypothetical protein EDB85DRAFT_2221248 [Lactarius pseudohatsudake]